jgi:signal transduction histidine kinase
MVLLTRSRARFGHKEQGWRVVRGAPPCCWAAALRRVVARTLSVHSAHGPQPRLIKIDDLEAQFDALVDALRRDVRRTRQQVEKFSRAYQRTAEAQSGGSTEGELDEATQRAYRRLKQLQLVVQHIESSVSYLLGSGIEPEVHGAGDQQLDVAQRVLESLEAERERLYRDVHDGPAQVLANAIFEVTISSASRSAPPAPADAAEQLGTCAGSSASLDSVPR